MLPSKKKFKGKRYANQWFDLGFSYAKGICKAPYDIRQSDNYYMLILPPSRKLIELISCYSALNACEDSSQYDNNKMYL